MAKPVFAGGALSSLYFYDKQNGYDILGSCNSNFRFTKTVYNCVVAIADAKFHSPAPEDKSQEALEEKTKLLLRIGNRILYVCQDCAGLYIKFGQHIATLNYVLPKEITTTLQVLQDSIPGSPINDLEENFIADFGMKSSEMFDSISPMPIAAASIGQVHYAKTKDGREVAVKLQYPKLEKKIQKDFLTFKFLARMVNFLYPELDYLWLVNEFEKIVSLELDFIQEGINAERTKRMFAKNNHVFIPQIFWDLSSKRILTMEFVHGVKANDGKAIKEKLNVDPKLVAKTITDIFGDMIFYHGFVHCDPHPGNLMVKNDSGKKNDYQVVILDHGMYKTLSPAFRRSYCAFWKAVVTNDKKLGEKSSIELGTKKEYFELLRLIFTANTAKKASSEVQKLVSKEEYQKFLKNNQKKINLESYSSFLEKLPRDMLFVLKNQSLIRSINYQLGGSTRQRLKSMGESAAKGLTVPAYAKPGVYIDSNTFFKSHQHLKNLELSNPTAEVNQIVDSEIYHEQTNFFRLSHITSKFGLLSFRWKLLLSDWILAIWEYTQQQK